MTKEEIDAAVAEHEASMERIWNVVKTWDYKTYRAAQMMFAPIDEEDEY
jgi:hypothetical protein